MFLANLVSAIHAALIVFVIAVPFSSFSAPLLLLHIATVVGLVMHWALSTDVCALTYLEAALRGVPPDKSFVYSVVGPVFNISDGSTRRIVFVSTVFLGVVSAVRLAKKFQAFRNSGPTHHDTHEHS